MSVDTGTAPSNATRTDLDATHPDDVPSSARPVDQRGSTTIPAAVVARIAAQAALEVPRIGSAAGGVLGIGARRDFAGAPSAECDLYGRAAVLRLDVGVDFPAPLTEVLGDLRRHLTQRVSQLTGLDVSRLDVTVSWLHPTDSARRLS